MKITHSFLQSVSGHTFYHHLVLQRMKENYFSQLDDYDKPFCEQQYAHESCLFVFFAQFKSVDQFNPPELPQILDIYSVVVL